ncbi:MAG: DUF4440 domain-containing protein [Acidobacteriota bacterium]
MKRCPTCQRSFDDDSLSFCLEDGTPLVTEVASRGDSQETLVSPRPPGAESAGGSAPAQSYSQLPGKSTVSASPYRPPETTYAPRSGGRKTWPWIVGVLAILSVVVIAILIVLFTVPGVLKSDNVNGAKPSPSQAETTPTPSPTSDVPTDSAEVLSQLTQIEKDWTEANVKGDKEALEKILADEYVSKEENSQTKRQYIDNLKPNDSIEEWEIYDVTVDQTGDRAAVNGNLKVVTSDETRVWDFVDTFVWRDGRWQAVTSHSTRVK